MDQGFGRQDQADDILQERRRNPLVLVGKESLMQDLIPITSCREANRVLVGYVLLLQLDLVSCMVAHRCCGNSRSPMRWIASFQAGKGVSMAEFSFSGFLFQGSS
jgi:hypothetical protein